MATTFIAGRGATVNAQQAEAALGIARAVAETIREMGPSGAPEGPLYMGLAEKLGIGLSTYESLVRLLTRSGLIERRANNTLVWVGGAL